MHRGSALTLDNDSLHVYDAVKFTSSLAFDFSSNSLDGYVMLELTVQQDSLSRVDLRLNESLTVDSVWATGGREAMHTRNGVDSLQIHLTPALQASDTVTVGISYHGVPAIVDSWGGFRWASESFWRPQIAYTMGDGLSLEPPPANYAWVPTYADPTDKALWEAWYRVPTGKTVTSNGVRVDTVYMGDGTTLWHYRLDQPVSTYLFFVSASDYVIQVQRETGPRIENFVYPSRVSQAQVHFSNVPAVLDSFVSRFGPYPFDRMGFNMTRLGDMEHATCVSHIDQVVGANHTYDWLLFHEMSHMWWGNWVTCGDWRDLWINEGFATWCEAAGFEALGGFPAYMQHVTTNLFPDAIGANDSYSIYDPDYYWGATVYQKGGSVMHMLRMLLGDVSFFAALREFGQEHAFSNAVTADWQAKLEQHYGETLDWFFQPWIYGTRFPRYRAVMDFGDLIVLRIDQVQTTDTRFRMPIDIRVYMADGDSTEFTVWNEAVASQSYILVPNDTLVFAATPTAVRIDPYSKILKTAVYQTLEADNASSPVPRRFELTSIYPNPFNLAANLRFTLPQQSPIHLRVFNVLGHQVAEYDLGVLSPGQHAVPFEGSGAASGVYLFTIESRFGLRSAKAVILK